MPAAHGDSGNLQQKSALENAPAELTLKFDKNPILRLKG